MKKIILSTFISIITIVNIFGQDPGFTQFYANPLYLNPAFAGSALCPRINLNYRNQWPALSGTYVTYSASYDQHVDKLSGGLGFLVTRDEAGEGTINTTNVSGIYSYQLALNNKVTLKAGFQATYAQKALDWSKLTFGDEIDPKLGFIYDTHETPGTNVCSNLDISSGILLFSKKFFGGFAMHHLTQPNESLLGVPNISKLPIKYTAHAGAMIPVGGRGTDTYISPNIIYMQQQDFTHLNLGMYVIKGPIVGGLWYRNQDALIALVGIQEGIFKFGYSYDITLSKLANVSAGSHELSCGIQLKCSPKRKKFQLHNCPTF